MREHSSAKPNPGELESEPSREQKESARLEVGFASEAGKNHERAGQENQDSLIMDEEKGIFVVADGMGGHFFGREAAQRAGQLFAEKVSEYVDQESPPDFLTRIMQEIDDDLRATEKWQELPEKRPGTTLTGLVRLGDDWWSVHVGDSALFRLRDGELQKLTKDMTMAGAMEISRDNPQFRNLNRMLLCYVGGHEGLDNSSIEIQPVDFADRDTYIVASDGLTNIGQEINIDNYYREIIGMLAAAPLSSDQVARQLVDYAKSAGSRDDVSVGIIRKNDE